MFISIISEFQKHAVQAQIHDNFFVVVTVDCYFIFEGFFEISSVFPLLTQKIQLFHVVIGEGGLLQNLHCTCSISLSKTVTSDLKSMWFEIFSGSKPALLFPELLLHHYSTSYHATSLAGLMTLNNSIFIEFVFVNFLSAL
jgi:hypothetical protein